VKYQIDEPQVMMVKEDAETIRKIKEVTSEGHDAEVRLDKDGKLKVIEVKKKVKK